MFSFSTSGPILKDHPSLDHSSDITVLVQTVLLRPTQLSINCNPSINQSTSLFSAPSSILKDHPSVNHSSDITILVQTVLPRPTQLSIPQPSINHQ